MMYTCSVFGNFISMRSLTHFSVLSRSTVISFNIFWATSNADCLLLCISPNFLRTSFKRKVCSLESDCSFLNASIFCDSFSNSAFNLFLVSRYSSFEISSSVYNSRILSFLASIFVSLYNTRRYQKRLNCMMPCEYYFAIAAWRKSPPATQQREKKESIPFVISFFSLSTWQGAHYSKIRVNSAVLIDEKGIYAKKCPMTLLLFRVHWTF